MDAQASNKRSWIGFLSVLLTVALGVIVVGRPLFFKSLQRASLAESMSNLRSVKNALDNFASDFQDQYPNDETRGRVSGQVLGTEFSNDYFRQLFLAQVTESEAIFWATKSPVARHAPPDEAIARDGIPEPDWILQGGECHWAYFRNQSPTLHGSRLLLLDPFVPGTEDFDPETQERGPVTVLIDGTVRVRSLAEVDLLLAPDSPAWNRSRLDPLDLLVQPEPVPK